MEAIAAWQGRRTSWRERRLRDWIQTLPTAEPVRALGFLAQSVRALNAAVLDPVTRAALLDLYEEPALNLAAALERPGASGAAFGLITTIHSERAQGLQMALTPDLPPDIRPLVVAGSVRALGEVLRVAYRTYVPAPPGLWRRLHGLMASVPEPSWGLERDYVRVVLLGLSDPYALPVGGVDAVRAIIGEVGDRAVLNTGGVGFAIHPDRDRVAEPVGEKAPLSLDTSAVLAELARLREDVRIGARLPPRLAARILPDLAVRLLATLGEAWRPGPRRRSLRVRLGGERLVCQGLAALQRLRAGDASACRYVDLEGPLLATDPPLGVGGPRPRVTIWTIRDAGRSGLWLSCQGLDGPPPAPGSWIGVKDPESEGSWRAATVRWLKRARPREYAMGVEVLGEAQTESLLRIDPRRAAFMASPVTVPVPYAARSAR